MHIAGVVFSPKVRLIMNYLELHTFVKSYIESNVETAVDPDNADVIFIASDLKNNLGRAFKTPLSVDLIDSYTEESIDDLSTAVALYVSTPLDVPSLCIH